MSAHSESSPSESVSDGNIRKRVSRACDRCRLKKSKCDGSGPCGRCRADNTICVFGERKKSHDKVYPKGYVEMLEQQQSQLVAGLRELYRRLTTGESWPGPLLAEQQGGHPLTHDILETLDLLQSKSSYSQLEPFEDDCSRLQKRLRTRQDSQSEQALQRRESIASDSDLDHAHASSPSSYGSPCTPPGMNWETAPSSTGAPSMHQPPQHALPLHDPGVKIEPHFWDPTRLAPQTAHELVPASFMGADSMLDNMTGNFPTPFSYSYYDVPMESYPGQFGMGDPWSASMNPDALQTDYAVEYA